MICLGLPVRKHFLRGAIFNDGGHLIVDRRSQYASLREDEPVARPLVRFLRAVVMSFPWSRSLIVAERQLGLVVVCRVGRGPTSATLAIERGAASIALDIHLEDC